MNEQTIAALFIRSRKGALFTLAQPEKEPTDIGVASQIAEVLRGHKRADVLGVDQRPDY